MKILPEIIIASGQVEQTANYLSTLGLSVPEEMRRGVHLL